MCSCKGPDALEIVLRPPCTDDQQVIPDELTRGGEMEVLSSRQLEPRIANQESIMYRCTSDASLETSSFPKDDSQIGKDGCFQITNQSETTSKVPPKRVSPEPSTETTSVVIEEPLSESEHLGLGGKIRQILESFNLEDFWHALVLGNNYTSKE